MKIMVISSKTSTMFSYRKDMMCEFMRHGNQVVAVGDAPENEWTDTYNQIGAKYRQIYVRRNGLNPLDDIKTLKSLIKIIAEEKPDKIFAYHSKSIVYGSIAARINKIKEMYALISGLGSIIRGTGFKNKIVKEVLKFEYKFAFKLCKKIITHNSDDRQLLLDEKYLKDPDKIKTVNGSGVNLDVFRYSATKKTNTFLIISRIIGDKGIREYVKAAEIVKKTHPEAKFKVAGAYDTNPSAIKPEEMEQYIEKGIIEYVGELADVRPELKGCMVYVLPSYHEGTPKTVLEAMATGRPVITTDVPGCRAAVQNGVNGYLVPAKDAQALAEKMIYALEHFDEIRELGDNGRMIAEDKYDAVKVNHSILDIMEIPYKSGTPKKENIPNKEDVAV